MRVLHLNSYDYRGGSETVFNLSRFNPYVEKNLSGFVNVDNNNNILSDVKLKTWESDSKLFGSINYIFSLRNFLTLKEFLWSNEIDVVHVHNVFSSLSPSIFVALKSLKDVKKFKVIQTVHDYHMICPNANLFNYNENRLCENCIGKKLKLDIIFENCDRRGWVYSFIKGLRNIVSNNVIRYEEVIDKFITPSEFLKTKLVQDGIERKKIQVIRNPVVINRSGIINNKKNVICYFGRFSQEKNVGFLIDAFIKWQEQKNNDFLLILIGEGEEEDSLKKKAFSSPFRDRIVFKPFVPQDILKQEISVIKYFTMSSKWYENAPMVIIEAVANGMIPIVPNLGGMKESINDVVKVGKTYQPDNIDSWIKTLNELEKNYHNEILKLKDSFKFISQFNLENYLIQLNKIYRNIIAV